MHSVPGTYWYRAVVKSGVCSEANSNYTVVTVDPTTVPGSVTGGTTICHNDNSGVLTLGGYTGLILRWEYSTNGGGSWTPIAHTDPTYTATNLAAGGGNTTVLNYLFRAVVQSGVCTIENSTSTTVTVYPTTQGGTVTGVNDEICYDEPSTGVMTLSGEIGSVLMWQRQYNATLPGGWSNIANTNTTYTDNTPLTAGTWYYRAVVQSGPSCAVEYSVPHDIVVHPQFNLAQLGGAASICDGTATNLSVTMTGGTSTYTINYTRSKDGGPAVAQPQINGYTSGTPFSTGILTTGTYVYTITSVTDAHGCYAESYGTPVTVIVGTNPSTATLTGSGDVCFGTTSYIYSTITGGAPNYIFEYTVFNGTVTTPYSTSYAGDGSAISLGALPVGSYTVTITDITDNCGTSIPIGGIPGSYSFNVNPIPDISGTTTNAAPICNGGATAITLQSTVANTDFSWSVTNISPAVVVSGYSSGSQAAGNGFVIAQNLTHSHTGPVTVTYEITSDGPGATNCAGNTITRDVVVNPVPQVQSVSNQTVCNGSATTAINFATTNTVGVTSYNWTNNTAGIGLAGSGSGNIASFTAINATTAPIVATITVTPTFTYGGTVCTGDASTQKTFTITINPTVTMNAVANQVVCDDASTTGITFGTNYTGGTGTVSYSWTNNTPSIGLAASGSGNIPVFTAVNNGTAPVTATIQVTPTLDNAGESCAGNSTSFTITVNPTVTVDAIADETVCNGSPTTSVVFASTGFSGGTITYDWTNSNSAIGLALSGTDDAGIPSFTATNTTTAPISGTITVTPTFSNGGVDCVGTSEQFTITVNPTVTTDIISDRIECNGASVSSIAFSTDYSGGTGTVTYVWSNDNTTIGLGAGGTANSLPSFTATNATTAPVTATITVTPTLSNGGATCVGTPESFTITVNPTVAATALSSQIVCDDAATAAVNFGVSAHSGGTVTYRWENDNTDIGLGASGTGATLPSFTATNNTTAPITGIITVTPEFTNSSGGGACDGTPTTFSITVNPTVSATALADQIICNGGNTTAVTFGVSAHSGGTVTYRWENDNTAIGLGTDGTGTGIPSFTVNNNPGTLPIVATISVYPIYTNSGGGPACEGTPTDFTISVNPTVSANAIADQIVCNNEATAAVTFGVSAHSGGTVTYRWDNDNPAIGLGASGTTSGIASFTATNGTAAPIVANITVTPVFTNSSGGSGCDGTPTTFSITVNPTAQVNNIASETVCNGSSTTAVTFTTDRSGGTTTYAWSINAAIGLFPTTGTGNFPSFTAVNTGTSPITATVTVTPTFANGGKSCDGPQKTFTITVNPTAQANDPGDRILCWGAASGAINFTTANSGGTTTYTWTNNNTNIGLAGSGTGNITSFTATNATTAPITGTITITPTFTNGVACSGPVTTFDITVNPRAQVDDPADLTRCNGEAVPAINFSTQNSGGTTTYTWTNSLPSIGLLASGSGNIATFTATNSGTATVTATITVTPHYTNTSGGATCDGPAQTFTITVYPTPELSTTLLPAEICSNNSFVYSPASATATTTFAWSRGALPANVTAGGPATGTDGINDLLRNFGSTTQTVEYTYTLTANGCVNTQVVTATVKPEPVISDQAPVVCSGQNLIWRILMENFAYPDVTFTWGAPVTTAGVTGGTARGSASSADINDSFINTTGSDGFATYTVTPYYNGCPGDPKDIIVTVGSQPVLADLDDFACSNTATGLTLGVAPGSSAADRYYVIAIDVDPDLIAAGGNATTVTMLDDPNGVGADYLSFDSFLNTSGADQTVTYTVRPSFGTDCLGDEKDIVITIRPQPVVVAGQVATVCSDEEINYEILLDPLNTPAGTTFSWDAPTMSDGSVQGTAVSGLAADPAGTFHITDALHNSTGAPITATYYVTPNSAFGCAGVEMPIVITINPEPVTSAITGDAVLCEGAINKVYSVVNHAGSTYQWGVTSGLNKIVDVGMYFIAVEALGGHTSSPDTIWVVETTSSTGCVGDTVYKVVSVVDVIPGVLVAGDTELCLHDTATYSVPFNASSVYSWTVPAGAVILTDPSLNTIDVTFNIPLSGLAGGISVHETTSGACTTDHLTTYVTVHPLPTVYNLTSPPAYCVGGNVDITLSGSQVGVMYQLYKDNVAEDAPIAGTGAALVWSGKEAGTYMVIATNATTTCVQVMNGTPSPFENTVDGGAIAAVQAICPGSSPDPFTSTAPGVGAGSITYQWQRSNDNFVGDINNIAGATSEIYAPVSLSSDTWFRRVAISTVGTSVCQDYSNIIFIDAIVFDPGSVTADQTICDNSIPAAFGSVTPTGDGLFTYQWQSSIDGFNFNNIVGADLETYTPSAALTQDTWYRRQVTSTLLGVGCVKFTPAVKVTVVNFQPGSIGSDQVICLGSTPSPFTGTAASGDGTFTYQWQDSTVTSGVWADVTTGSGGTTANYAPAALTENTWFRRVVTARDVSDLSVACVDITNTVLVSVIDFDPGTISGDQVICEGATVTTGFTGTAATSNTPDTYIFTYQWQKFSGASFVDITGAVNADYTPVEALVADTRYRRVATATYGSRQCQSISNEITVIVNNITAGTVTGTQTICEDAAPTVLSYSGNSGEAGATVTHQWEYSTDNWATSAPIGAVDDMTLLPGPLSVDTRFRVVATSDRGGVVCEDISNSILVTVINFAPGNIAADQSICEGSNAATLTSVTPTGDGVFSYRWYEGTAVDPNAAIPVLTFAALPSSNSETWNPGILAEDRWYVREVTSTLNGVQCVENTDTVWVRVNNLDPGSIVTAAYTICDGASMTDIDATAAVADGLVAYMWQSSSDGTNFSDTGVTTEDYAATAITADTWFRRMATSTVTSPVNLSCTEYTGTIKVTVINFVPGAISSDQTICLGSAPLAFTSVAASGDGVKSYQWQDSTATSGVWANVPSGGTSATYSAGVLGENTWFRRIATATLNGVSCNLISNVLRVTVIDFDPGTISTDQVICEGEIPAVLSGTAASDLYPADGYVYSYQWQSRTASGSYVNIPLATDVDYTPTEQLYEDMYYRRRVTATAAGAQCVLYTNELHVTVNNFTVGSITAAQTICESTAPATLVYSGTPVGGDGDSYDLMWQYKTVSDADYIDMPGETAATLDPGALTEDTWFRLEVTSNIGATNSCPKYTNEIRITVNNFDPGVIGTDQVICANTAASTIGSTTAASGDGVFTYMWYSSTDNITFASTGITTESYTPGVLANDMWYYRSVTSTLNGTACTEDNLPVYIQVNNVDAGTITGTATICEGADGGTISSNADHSFDGTDTYQWYESVDGVAFTAITGANTDSYAAGTLTADRWYKLRVISTIGANVCYDETDAVRVTVINFTPGTISNDQVICYNTAPAAFTATAPGGDGTFTYRWESSTDGGTTYAPIAGATAATYTSPALTADTWFRRVTISTLNAVSCEHESNEVFVDVIIFDEGSIGGDQDICEGSVPAILTSTADASGEGLLQYQWQVSADNTTFNNITGANSNEYQPGALTQDTWYRRVVTSTVGARTCTYITNTVKVTVNNILTIGSITGTQTICEGATPAGFASVAGTVDGVLSYQWYNSIDGTTFNIMAGETGELFTPVALTQDTWYKRYVVSTMGLLECTKETGTIKVTVNNFDPGVIGTDQVICANTAAAVLGSTTAPSGDGVFSYLWYSSTDGATWSSTGVTTESYTPGVLANDMWYYRSVTSTLNGTACTEDNLPVYIQVNNVDAGTITGTATICEGADGGTISSNADHSFDGTDTYQWYESVDGVAFTAITGANTDSYAAGTLTADRWYKLRVISTIGANVCYDETDAVRVTVINFTPGTISNDQVICYNTAPAAFTATAPGGDGTFTYRWESSTDGGTTYAPIAGATAATYTSPALTADTWFRRVTISTLNAVSCEHESNEVFVDVIIFDEGSIGGDQDICEGSVPAILTSTADASGEGLLQYQWQVSADNTTFNNITGANSNEYQPGALTQDTWYRRVVTSTVGARTCTYITNTVKVTVNNILTIGSITGTQTICEGATPAGFASVAGTVDGVLSYQWYNSIDGTTFNIMAGETGELFTPVALTQDTWYKRYVVSTMGLLECTKETGTIKVTVNNFDPGVIGTDQVICANTAAAVLGSTTAPSGDGVFSYLWYSSTDGATWSSTGVTTESYTPGVLANDMWYYRSVTSTLNGTACTEDNLPVYIQVNNVDAGTITGTATICEGADGGTISSNADHSFDGTDTYQWYESVDGVAFTAITGANTDSYAAGTLTADRWYKLRVISTIGANVCYDETDAVRVTVINFIPGAISSDQTICLGSAPLTFTSVAASGDGTITYQWQDSTATSGVWNNVASGGTSATYSAGVLAENTWFRRIATATLNTVSCLEVSNTVRITVIDFDPGAILDDQIICEGEIPVVLTGTAASDAYPADGYVYTYQWQSRTASGSYTNIPLATGVDFTPTEQLYEDMYYRRRVTATAAGSQCVLYTNELHVTVNNFTVGSISAAQTICESTAPATLVYSGTPVGGDGDSYDLMWQYKTVSDADYIDMPGETAATLDPGALTEDTWFRLEVTSNIGATNSCPKYTNEIRITVNNFDPGVIGTDQVICANTAASTIGSTTAASGDGVFTYMWYSSTDNITFASTGITTESYTPGVLANDMWYYRSVTSTLNGTACTEDNLPVYIQVNNVDAGTITGTATICEGADGGTISSNADHSFDGTDTYQWYESVDGVAFTAITGANTDSYAAGTLTADRWYKLRVISTIGANVCYDETDAVRVTVINFTPGTISNDQVICYNTAPAAFTATAPGGDGTFTYRWESSTDGGTTYAPIAGATAATYTSPALTADTWFRRVTISTLNAVSCEHESNEVFVDVIIFDEGSIGGDQDICEGSVPAILTSTADASGEGLLQYQWQVSADNTTFNNITGANSNEYQPGALTQDTWYRRVVTSTVGARTCTYITNTVKVTVNNILTIGSITGTQTICEGATPAGFASVAGTVDGVLSYQWYNSIDGTTFNIMAGETGELFTPVALTQDTWYKRYVVSTMGLLECTKETGTIKVTVNNFDPGSIAGEQTVCLGTPASVITSVTPTGDGVFSYRWYSSTVSDVAGFALVPGALSETYYPGAPAQDTWYYREVTSTLNGVPCVENTNVVKVTVNNMTAGAIGNDETMCAGTVPANITMTTAPYFDGGTPSYQWMVSNDNVNFTNISGATGNSYQPAALTQDTWYRLTVTSTLNGVACSNVTNVVAKLVNNVAGGSIISDQAICNGGDPVMFVSTLNGSGDGLISYRWEQSNTGTAGTFTAIAGTNSPTYDPPVLGSDRYFRRVTISDLGGLTCEAVSNTVKVTVNTVLGGAIGTAQEICFGETPVAFTSTDPGSGTGTVTYRWYRSSDGTYFSLIAGANLATYAPGVLYADAWYKRELVSNLTGNICTAESNILHITVHPRPVAILSGGATICPSESTNLTVDMMVGTGPYDVELTSSFDGSIVSVSGYSSGDPIAVSPAATTTYTLTSVTDAHGCAVTPATYPSNLSGTALVTVRLTPVIVTSPVDVTQCEYGVATFTVTATGTDVAYQWYENGVALSDGGMYYGANNATLNIYGVLRDMDGNVYNAVASNCSTDVPSATAMLTVNTAPEITDQPDDATICSTQGTTFEVVAQGTAVTYQWQVNRQDGLGFVNVVNDSNFSGSDLSVLTLTNVPGSFNNYIFRVRLNGTCGSAVYSNFVALRVNVPPTVTRNPVDAALCDGAGMITFLGGGSGLIDSLRWQVSTDGVTWNDIYDNSNYSGTMTQQMSIIDAPLGFDGYQYRLALKAFCSTVYTDAATLTVNANPVVDFSAIDPIAACGGVATVIDGNPTGGSGVYTQHTWTGDVGPLSNYFVQTPTFLTSVAGSYNLTYKVKDSNGCVAEGDVEVVVEMPDASYTMNTTQGCTPAEVTFTKDMSGVDHWEWDFGDGTTSTTEASPVHTFTNANATSIEYYNVKLTVWTAGGCSAEFTRMVTVYPAVNATFTAANDSICSGTPLLFTGVTGASSYFWDFGDGVTGSGEANATHVYTNVTTSPIDVVVSLTARSFYGCETTETMNITVMPVASPLYSITETPPYIYDPAGNTLHFVNNTGAGAWGYLWDFGDGTTSTDTNPVHTYNDLGDYEVTLTVFNELCTSSVVHTVSILPRAPIASFNEIASGCSPLVIAPVNTSQETQYPGTTYLWDFGDGSYSTAENPEYTYHTDGIYRVELTVTGPGGVSTYSQVVESFASPNAYLEVLPTAVFVNDEAVRCFNLSIGADYYLWEFGDGDTSRLEEPYHKYMEEGVYDITLWAYSENGCSDRYVLSPGVTVEPAGELQFATVFRPSLGGPTTSDGGISGTPIALPEGGEELDRYFFPPIREKVTGYKLQIFNRLGVLIFQSNDINVPWDGYYRGALCPQGVYVWYVEGKYSNGEPFRQVGDITLLY